MQVQAQMNNHVNLVASSDPRYDQLMSAHFALLNSSMDSKMRGSSAILENNSDKGIVGYVVKWTETANGVSRSRYQVFDRTHLLEMKTIPAKYQWVAPHTYRVVNPTFTLHETEAQAPATIEQMQKTTGDSQLAKTIENGTTFIPTIDMVIFEDGTYQGPDEGKTLPLLIAERNGKHDIGAIVLVARNNGETAQQIESRLQQEVSKGETSSAYGQARGRYAAQLLTVYKTMGSDALYKNATTFAALHKLNLTNSE